MKKICSKCGEFRETASCLSVKQESEFNMLKRYNYLCSKCTATLNEWIVQGYK